MEWKDYYEILGVSREASPDEIKKAYRRKMKEWHPDTHPGNEEAAEKSREANEAYEILENEETKKRYDQTYEECKKNGYQDATQNYQYANANNNGPTVEDIYNDLNDDEKKHIERMRFIEVMEEELAKVDLVVATIHEIIYGAYCNPEEIENYYSNVREVVECTRAIIEGYEELKINAQALELISEAERINTNIDFLKKELRNIPVNPIEAGDKVKKEIYGAIINEKIAEEIVSTRTIIDEFNKILISAYKFEILPFEYYGNLEYIKLMAKVKIDSLRQLSEISQRLGLNTEIDTITEALGQLNFYLIYMPNDYNLAMELGEKEDFKVRLFEKINEYNALNNKLQRILSLIKKYPNSWRIPSLCDAATKYLVDYENELKNFHSKLGSLFTDTRFDISHLIEQAINIYNESSAISYDVDEVFQKEDSYNRQDLEKILKAIDYRTKKIEAVDLLVKAKELETVLKIIDKDNHLDFEIERLLWGIRQNKNKFNKIKKQAILELEEREQKSRNQYLCMRDELITMIAELTAGMWGTATVSVITAFVTFYSENYIVKILMGIIALKSLVNIRKKYCDREELQLELDELQTSYIKQQQRHAKRRTI